MSKTITGGWEKMRGRFPAAMHQDDIDKLKTIFFCGAHTALLILGKTGLDKKTFNRLAEESAGFAVFVAHKAEQEEARDNDLIDPIA
jgi:hypothetical protein